MGGSTGPRVSLGGNNTYERLAILSRDVCDSLWICRVVLIFCLTHVVTWYNYIISINLHNR